MHHWCAEEGKRNELDDNSGVTGKMDENKIGGNAISHRPRDRASPAETGGDIQ
jgi:hypothetical protein